MSNKPVQICETALRDAHQSLLATRMRVADMLPIAAKMDQIGYWSVEMWGGATFDSAMRFLDENPWERISKLKEKMPNTRFQMLLRGQNIVGYRHYPDDLVEKFIQAAVNRGIDVFRIFDALNDVRNMRFAMETVKKYGGHVQAAISYTTSPVHDVDVFVQIAKELAEVGMDSLCIKDMAGLLTPYTGEELVRKLKKAIDVPIQLHSHYTSGMAAVTYVKAVEAGVDTIDTAISPMSSGTSQPATESLVAMLQGTDRDTGLDIGQLSEVAGYFSEIRKNYAKFESGFSSVDVRVLRYQIPGGMLSNLISQLREQGALDRYEEVLAEVPRVRKDLGYPPLVTPSSQIVGTQSTLNVLLGERYKLIPQEVHNYVKGMYGRSPAEINPELKKRILGDDEPIDCRPADLLEPGFEKAKEEIGDLAQNDQDVLMYAIFPSVAKAFLEKRASGALDPENPPAFRDTKKKEATIAAPRPTPRRVYNYPMWKLAGRAGLK